MTAFRQWLGFYCEAIGAWLQAAGERLQDG